MSTQAVREYVSIGGNRHSAASAWSKSSGLLAFGADQNIAIWTPLSVESTGIEHLLYGHKDKVTSVNFLSSLSDQFTEYILSGSADGKLLAWAHILPQKKWQLLAEIEAHAGAVNCIATIHGLTCFVTGGADAKIRIWKLDGHAVKEVLTIIPKPRLIPLALALGAFPDISSNDGLFLTAAGTRNDIQVYALIDIAGQPKAEHQASLHGHEGWVRSLSFRAINEHALMLASASHDKYIRLWRFEHGDSKTLEAKSDPSQVTTFEQTLTAKVQKVSVGKSRYSITFEALLLGHEDWVYSASWNPAVSSEQLLSASADGTLTIWESDPTSGIWISASKLGEISGQKGATTATGSSGGFWAGHWSPDGQSVTCLGRTGSWRIWDFDRTLQYWTQKHGVSGHVGATNGLAWSPGGDYLLSTSSDQTTRLHAEWRRGSKRTWHEFARPQIHGYDLNCISPTGNHQFASGADEKLLRIFNEPKDIAKMLDKLCRIKGTDGNMLSENAAIPVLGLSNKAMVDGEDVYTEANGNREPDYITPDQEVSVAGIEEPPTEDLLARHTLWPEHEKLYGHGYEISESAYSNDRKILATACKASSIDHAVIRLYDTTNWNEIKPALAAHTLTVTRLIWSSPSDNYLLSVGRDRQWAVFHQDQVSREWKLLQSNPKAHTRMILDACWSPIPGLQFFATAGRDKTVKIWSSSLSDSNNINFQEMSNFKLESSVTALSATSNRRSTMAILAVGEESGAISLHTFTVDQKLEHGKVVTIDRSICPLKAVTKMAWRSRSSTRSEDDETTRLAVASTDGSVTILSFDVERLCS